MTRIKVCDLAKYYLTTSEIHYSSTDPHGEHEIENLATDSRCIDNDADKTVFAALRTSVGDGRRFIAESAMKGVKVFIVDELTDSLKNIDATFIVVPSVSDAIISMARTRMGKAKNGIIVTGSHGKTTVKELIYRALQHNTNVRRSPRSWNSHIGIALALWDIANTDTTPDIFITEAAIDAPNQADKIVDIAGEYHNIAVITPIDTEHDEAFDSHALKVAEKIKIASTCNTIIYVRGDKDLEEQLDALSHNNPDVNIIAVDPADSFEHTLQKLAAQCIASTTVGNTDAAEYLYTLPIPDTRRHISAGIFGNNIIRDAFTPDLRSLLDSIVFFRRHTSGNRHKVLICGNLIDANSTRIKTLGTAKGFDEVLTTTDTDNSAIISSIEAGQQWRDADILIFGDTQSHAEHYAHALEGAGHDTVLEIDLDAIVHNYNHYRHLVAPGTGIIAMVKASAYGMGAREIARTLQDHGAAALAVAVIEEGVDLREAGITMPIIVLNPITNQHHTLFSHHLEPTVFSPDELQTLLAQAVADGVENYPVHIKLDTGMHRVGFLEEQLIALADTLRNQNRLRVASTFTHLATADCLDMDTYTIGQIDTYHRLADILEQHLGYSIKRHFLNTAGMMRFASAMPYDMSRLGIGLYGIAPYDGYDTNALKPVATFSTHIISIKHWPKGTPIGYGCKGRTSSDSIIATIPVGYADGINRHLGRGNAAFFINDIPCPTIGNICMDQCMIDITNVPNAGIGSKVTIFSPKHSVERLSKALDTIPYEILTSISPRVRRAYIKR